MDNVCLGSIHSIDGYQCSVVAPINRARLQFNLLNLSYFIIVLASSSVRRI